MPNNQNIEEIRKQANIVDIISSYIPLTLKGKNYFGVCPFHEDHSPSMSVSPSKQIYKCFSCGAAGNVFLFVKNYLNISFLEAVKVVAEKCGINYVIKEPVKKNYDLKEYEVMDMALKFFRNNIYSKKGEVARVYLAKRDLKIDAIKTFNLGYAKNQDDALGKMLLSRAYDVDMLETLGLVRKNGTDVKDMFINRVIFPIHDLEGRVVGFTARSLENVKSFKYINSKESTIFKKGQLLFNYHRAIEEIRSKKEVIVVEGNMDAIRMYLNGIKNVVALMGTALTGEQVEILKKLHAKVLLMLDNDEAGESATLTDGSMLEKANIEVEVVRLSGEKDPDEYIIKNGVEALLENIKRPISFLNFKLNYYKKNKDLGKTEDLALYIKQIVESLKDVNDDLTREITLKKLSEEYEIDINVLKGEMAKFKRKEIRENKTIVKLKTSKYDMAALNILYYMMNNSNYIKKFQKDLGYFKVKDYRSVANEIVYYYEKNGDINVADFLSFVEDKDYIYEVVLDIIKKANNSELDGEEFDSYVKICVVEEQKEKIKKLKQEIEEEFDQNKKLELVQRMIEIKKGCVGNE